MFTLVLLVTLFPLFIMHNILLYPIYSIHRIDQPGFDCQAEGGVYRPRVSVCNNCYDVELAAAGNYFLVLLQRHAPSNPHNPQSQPITVQLPGHK